MPGLCVSAQPSAATSAERSAFIPIEMESPMTRYCVVAEALAGVAEVLEQRCAVHAHVLRLGAPVLAHQRPVRVGRRSWVGNHWEFWQRCG